MTNELWALLVLLVGLAYFLRAMPIKPRMEPHECRLYLALIGALIVGVLIAMGERLLS